MRTLGNVSHFLSGGTPKKNNSQYWGGEIPWYSAANMKSKFLSTTDITITHSGLDAGSRIAPKSSTLILVRGSGLFNHIPICFADQPVAFNQDVKALVPLEGIDPLFFHYWIESLRPTLIENLGVTGIGAGKIDTDFLKGLPFPEMPLSEQREIGLYASSFDRKIEINHRTAATLEEMARALYRSWFVDFDPVHAKAQGRAPAHMDPTTAAFFPNRFGEDGLPEGWERGTLRDLIDFNPRERLKKGMSTPYLDMKALPTSGMIANSAYMRSFTSGTKFREGDTLLARITPCLENGKTAMVDDLLGAEVGWGSTEFIVMRGKAYVPPIFAYCVARDSDFREAAIATMTGSSGRQRADADRISHAECALPTQYVLDAFGYQTAPMVKRIHGMGRENQTLAQLRDTLLPKLMSGELRIREAQKQVEAVA
ncbi:restriction endonuclease subunit S [Celeribacter halophilus]|uniref:restriction endonuclease subunit S n=1 Tax=Celeribacter halophilus TaxID=576117 RepID=UPI003A9085D9